jgi:hypothetical protein
VVRTDPRVGVSYGEERGSLERLRENLEVGGRCGEPLGVNVVDANVDLHMPCRL